MAAVRSYKGHMGASLGMLTYESTNVVRLLGMQA
jgi:hypothetical protein